MRVPRGNDTEYKCMGSASDGSVHAEGVFALQRRAGSRARSGSQCQGDR